MSAPTDLQSRLAALSALWDVQYDSGQARAQIEYLREAARIGAELEREACALVCDRNAEHLTDGRRMVATFLAEEIRARGAKP